MNSDSIWIADISLRKRTSLKLGDVKSLIHNIAQSMIFKYKVMLSFLSAGISRTGHGQSNRTAYNGHALH